MDTNDQNSMPAAEAPLETREPNDGRELAEEPARRPRRQYRPGILWAIGVPVRMDVETEADEPGGEG